MGAIMTNPPHKLTGLPHPERIRSTKVANGVATIIAEAGGLNEAERKALEDELRSAAMQSPDVNEVRIALTASDPTRTVIAVGSGKGGVGKSTVATNLAIALARAGKKVGLIDADVYGPSQTTLLGSSSKPEASGDRLVPVEAHGIKFLSLGQLVAPGQALAWRGPMATGALARLLDGDWGDAEFLIIDLPPGTGDVQISLIQKSRPDGAIIVSTSQDLSLIDAERAIDLFNRTQVPVLGVIENMAGYICPHCGKESNPFGTGGAEKSAKRLHVPFLGRLPLSVDIRKASDSGAPIALGDDADAGAFAEIADRMLRSLDTVGV